MPKFTTNSRILIILIIFSLCSPNKFNNYLQAQTREATDQYYYLEGLRQYNIGSMDQAQKIFQNLIKRGTKNDAVYYYSANIMLQKGDMSKAEGYMSDAIKLDPENYWYSVQLAKIYSTQNKLDNAIKIYEDLRIRYPQKVDLYDDMIDLYIEQKNYDKASKVVDEVESNVGKSEATGLTRYNIMIFENKKQEAFEYLKNFDNEFCTPRTSTLLGDYYTSVQNDTSALFYYNKALSMDPSYIPANFGIAEIYRIKGQFDRYFEKIYPFLANPEVNSKMKVNYMNEILSSKKFVQTFMPQVDTMMSNLYLAHSKDTAVVYSYALYLVQTGRTDPGLRVLNKNLQENINIPESHRQYLSLLYYMENWEELTKCSDSALVRFPKDPRFMELKGVGLLQLKKIPESIAIFKDILRLTKGDSASTVRNLAILGDLYYQIGAKAESFKYYRKTLKKEPNQISSLNNYAYYLSEEGKQLNKAYKMSKKTIEAEPDNATYLDTYAWILHLLDKNIEAKAMLKHALIYGGKDNATILDHYAEILFSLKEYDLAYIYWGQADKLDPTLGLAAKIERKKREAK